MTEQINRTVLTVNCDNKPTALEAALEADQNNNNDKASESDSDPQQSYHLNIQIAGDSPTRSAKTTEAEHSDDILVSLARSAKEMREIIMGRKKKDPRKEKRKDLRKRVEMVEQL